MTHDDTHDSPEPDRAAAVSLLLTQPLLIDEYARRDVTAFIRAAIRTAHASNPSAVRTTAWRPSPPEKVSRPSNDDIQREFSHMLASRRAIEEAVAVLNEVHAVSDDETVKRLVTDQAAALNKLIEISHRFVEACEEYSSRVRPLTGSGHDVVFIEKVLDAEDEHPATTTSVHYYLSHVPPARRVLSPAPRSGRKLEPSIMALKQITAHGLRARTRRDEPGPFDTGKPSAPGAIRLDLITTLLDRVIATRDVNTQTRMRWVVFDVEKSVEILSLSPEDHEELRVRAEQTWPPEDRYALLDEHLVDTTGTWLIELMRFVHAVYPEARMGQDLPDSIEPKVAHAVTLLIEQHLVDLVDPEKEFLLMNERLRLYEITQRLEATKSNALDAVINRHGHLDTHLTTQEEA